MSTATEKSSSFRRVQLGEIADFVMGQAPPGDASNFDGVGTIFVKAGEFGASHPIVREWTTKPLKFAKAGDVLICVVGATAGKLNLGIDCAIGRSVAAIRPSSETFDRFVYLQLQPKVLELRSNSTGSAQGVISRDMLAKIEMLLPDLSEQGKIVGEIEKQFTRLEAGVAALRRVQANLKRYRAAVLKAACEGQLVPTEANQWRQVALEEVCSKITDGEHQTPKRQAAGKMLLSAKNVRDGFVDYRDHDLISESDFQKCRVRCDAKPNDILIVCVGATIGRTAIVREETEFALVRSVALLRPEKVNPKFLLYAVQSDIGQKQIANVKRGSAQACLYLNRIRKITIPLPPLAEQTRIVAEVERRLSVVEELESVVSANLQRATRLRQSILQKAFAGKLVKPEPAIDLTKIIPPLKPEHINGPNRHFARALLSAEIVHQLHGEPTFGRVKHQKIFHLCEHIAQIAEIEGQYHREAAGPLDNKLIYTNEAELKKQQWYQEVHRQSYGHAYQPLAKAGDHRKYVERYWPDKLPMVEKLIELMRSWDTDRCEIFCTAYAAWNDLILWGKQATEDNILHEILNRWHDSKKRFPAERWRKAIGWMKKEGFVPTGFGKPTSEAK